MIIGLTGQSGSGKSVVASIISQYNINIIDCDKIAHQNMQPEGVAYNDIVKSFGNSILNSDGTINRKILGNIVFNDDKKLKLLNKLTHIHIIHSVKEKLEFYNYRAVIDAPLLFEAGLDSLCDKIWAVVCPEEIRIERVVKRDNISFDEAKARFKNQKPMEFFIERADVVFENSGDIEGLKERVVYEINKIFI